MMDYLGNMDKLILLLLLSLTATVTTGQQDTIKIRKPSFEQKPHAGAQGGPGIRGWYDCGIVFFPTQSPPDIHPVNFWGNTKQAHQGDTYLGMVVRNDDSYESVSQKLASKMIAGDCYSFSVYLSKSERYLSGSPLTGQDLVNYTEPVVFRIWGGFGYCDQRQLLGETVPVDHTEWKRYDFKFKPTSDISSITIEAFYKVPVVVPYSGHVLVDDLSPIVRVDCEPKAEVAKNETPKRPPHKRRIKKEPKQEEKPAEQAAVVEQAAVKPKEKILTALNRDEIREGQTIEITNLYFEADTSSINENSYEVLDEVYSFLKEYIDVTVEIGGHTNSTPKHAYCDKLSKERAKAVAQYLVRKGIPPNRLKYKGYGKRKPIANNRTVEGRKKNQRVEIKILTIG